MMINNEDLIRKLNDAYQIKLNTAEEYFLTLGQFLIYTFSLLGGVQRHSKEFNYLTNPYLSQDVQQLGIRTVRFLSKLPRQLFDANSCASDVLEALISLSSIYCYNNIKIHSCTEAFFEGLHSQVSFGEK